MMKTIHTKFLMLALVASVSLLPSCRKAAENARKNIRVEAVEQVVPHGLSGFDLTLRVKNDTKYKLVLRDASLALSYAGARVVGISLLDGVEVMPRTTGSVTTRWRMEVEDPIALFVLARRVGEGNLSQMTVSYDVEGRGGPMPINISQPEMPLSEFLRIFGIDINDIKHYLGQ